MVVLIVFSLVLISLYYPYFTGEVAFDYEDYETEKVFVLEVIDGDTIKTNISEIRLLGINAPERKKAYYNEAKEFLREIENKTIEVLRDFEDLDKYDRKLRYVFYNNRFLNIEILENGLATSFMIDDLKYEDKLIKAEKFAIDSKIGLWERSRDRCADCIRLIELNAIEEYFVLENICEIDCDLSGWVVKDNANHFFKLNDLHGGESEKIVSKGHIWNNDGDRFFMRDDEGGLVIFYSY